MKPIVSLFFCPPEAPAEDSRLSDERSRKLRASSSGSEIGGWQVNPEQTIATVFSCCIAGSCGMVSANAGGRFCGTALLAASLRTDFPTE